MIDQSEQNEVRNMNNPNQNYNHTEPRQERDQFRYAAQVPIAGPEYRVTIEHGSIGYSQERWVP